MRCRLTLTCATLLLIASIALPASTASAAPTSLTDALDVAGADVYSSTTIGAATAITTSSVPFGSFPRTGSDYIVMSTGNAAEVIGGDPSEFISTSLGAGGGADGNDLTQLSIELTPSAGATCLAFDFQFLSEEYPEYVGSRYNDIFTAELSQSRFDTDGSQVVAPNNFAYDSGGNFISINTVLGFHPATDTRMDGTTDPLVAVSPIEKDLETGRTTVVLSIQDIGDSVYDSAVLLDNFRWLYGSNCERTVGTLTDSDGDGLPDEWEQNGIDYDGDGSPEVDLPALGADPQRADIFLEVDWMEKSPRCLVFFCWGGRSFAPDRVALQDVVGAFAAAPYSNPDGSAGITLHIDAGVNSPGISLGGGNSIPWTSSLGTTSGGLYDWTAFEEVKNTNFASLRRDVFHYVVYADHYGGSDSSGISRGIPGADLIVSDGPWSDAGGFTRIQERGTLMHELGHNLDLKHGGIDHTTYQYDAAYRSVMNYLYQLVGLPPGSVLDYSRGTPFNDWVNIRFDGGSIGDLGESAPIMETVDDTELTPEVAIELAAAAVEGDGALEVLGPNVFGAGKSDQTINVRVWNPGSSNQEYVLSGSVGEVIVPNVAVDVDPTSSENVAVRFDASTLPVGDTEFEVSLTSVTLGTEVDAEITSVMGVDTNDVGVRDELLQDADAAANSDDPPPTVVLSTLMALVGTDNPAIPTPTSSSTPTPSVTSTPSAASVPSMTSTPAAERAVTPTASGGNLLPLTGRGGSATMLVVGGVMTVFGVLLVAWVALRRRLS